VKGFARRTLGRARVPVRRAAARNGAPDPLVCCVCLCVCSVPLVSDSRWDVERSAACACVEPGWGRVLPDFA